MAVDFNQPEVFMQQRLARSLAENLQLLPVVASQRLAREAIIYCAFLLAQL